MPPKKYLIFYFVLFFLIYIIYGLFFLSGKLSLISVPIREQDYLVTKVIYTESSLSKPQVYLFYPVILVFSSVWGGDQIVISHELNVFLSNSSSATTIKSW